MFVPRKIRADLPRVAIYWCGGGDAGASVVVPGAVDHTDRADAAFARFAEAGAHIVRSEVPMAEWPGVVGESLAGQV